MEQNGLQVFDFEGRQTRVAFKGGEPWWVAADVCDILNLGTEQIRRLDDDEKALLKMQTNGGKQDMFLGYVNSKSAIEKHCKHKETFGVAIRDTGKGSVQQMVIIPESDVYRLIIRSNMPEAPEAERFEIAKN